MTQGDTGHRVSTVSGCGIHCVRVRRPLCQGLVLTVSGCGVHCVRVWCDWLCLFLLGGLLPHPRDCCQEVHFCNAYIPIPDLLSNPPVLFKNSIASNSRICVCVCVCLCARARVHRHTLSHVHLLAFPWTVACQAPLSMEFSKQEYWSGLLFPSPGDYPDPGIKSVPLVFPALAGGFFTTVPPGKPLNSEISRSIFLQLLVPTDYEELLQNAI